MDLARFMDGYTTVLFSPEKDDVFSNLRLTTEGMSSPKEGKLLNYACQLMDNNEYYLEIGTYLGFTLCSAGYEQGGVFVGIDNFTESYSPRYNTPKLLAEKAAENTNKFVRNNLVLNGDFRSFDLSKIIKDDWKIGVFYVDGKHTKEDVIDSIKQFQPYLSDQAVVVFDDTNIEGVREGILEILKDKRFEEVFYVKPGHIKSKCAGYEEDHYAHCGFSVCTYRGKN